MHCCLLGPSKCCPMSDYFLMASLFVFLSSRNTESAVRPAVEVQEPQRSWPSSSENCTLPLLHAAKPAALCCGYST